MFCTPQSKKLVLTVFFSYSPMHAFQPIFTKTTAFFNGFEHAVVVGALNISAKLDRCIFFDRHCSKTWLFAMVFAYSNPKGWYLQCFVTPWQGIHNVLRHCMHKTNVNISKFQRFLIPIPQAKNAKTLKITTIPFTIFGTCKFWLLFSHPFAEHWKDDTSQAKLKEDARWKFPEPSNTKRRCGVGQAILKEEVGWKFPAPSN